MRAAVLLGLAIPAAAALTVAFPAPEQGTLGLLTGVAGGVLAYIGAAHLLPEAQTEDTNRVAGILFVATLLIYYVAVKAGFVPTSGWPEGFWQLDSRVILPSFALGLFPMAYFARLVRGAMLETMQQDYVRTAKAKGLRSRRVIGLHVLRNSLIPAVTATAPLLGLIITGTFVIEFIFSIPGIGRYFINSVSNRDYSVVMGITVLTSVIIVVANLFVDIMYGVLDPRTREAR